jgi:multiple sugar transport system permease protein
MSSQGIPSTPVAASRQGTAAAGRRTTAYSARPPRLNMRRREAIACYVFMTPAILGLVLFALGPMLASLLLSFTNFDMLTLPTWVGLDNYRQLVNDELFLKSLRVTATYSLVTVPLILVISFVLALLLNQKLRGMYFFRSVYYLPTVMSGVAVGMLWRWMFNGEYGLINTALGKIGITGPNWFLSEEWALPALIVTSLWTFGGTTLIYLAGLQGVPAELYEAAQVDGANRLRQHLHITVPMVSHVTFFNLVMGVIGSLQVFAEPYVLTGGGPNNSTLLLPLYLYRNAFEFLKMGYASAIAWVSFVVVLALTLLVFRSLPYWVHYEGDTGRQGR